MRVAFVEWPDALSTTHAQWDELKDSVNAVRADLLITNELPFGPWLADSAVFSEDDAHLSLSAHEKGLEGLNDLALPAVISSRPVWNGKRLANEAFVLENGAVRPLHRKQYFPNEPGWFESEWYAGDGSGFGVTEILGVKVGVLLCTEAMFNEHARAYGKQAGSLVVIPRASGVDIESWKIAGAMASLVSGALRCQFEPGWRFQRWYALWRRRLRVCATWTSTGGDSPGQSCADPGTRSKNAWPRATRISLLCS
jgi:N-carbamoylputrescine amidase